MGSWILRSISYHLARKGSKIDMTPDTVVAPLTMAFKATVFNVLLIQLRASVKLVLMRFSISVAAVMDSYLEV